MPYVLILLLIASDGTSSMEIGRFKTEAECKTAAEKSTYNHRQGTAPSFGLLCVAAGNYVEE